MDISDPEEYFKVVKYIYSLIYQELDRIIATKGGYSHYPKAVIMYQFFRLLRGEAFTGIRPSVGERQKELYDMENNIRESLDLIKSQIDPEDEQTKRFIKEMQDRFLFTKEENPTF